MRKEISTLAVIGALLVGGAASAAEGGLRYTISVAKFDNQAGYIHTWSVGDAWGTVMTDLLQQTGKFIVLGETDMRNEAMMEQDLVASGRTAQGAKAPVTGELTPAQLLVKGAITHVQHETAGGGGGIRVKGIRLGGKKATSEINATVYVVDATTGQIVASKSVVGTSKGRGGTLGYSGRNWGGDIGSFKEDNLGKAVESAVSEAVDWIVAQVDDIPWRGSVALVQGGKVYVNRGAREGVANGQTFVVGESQFIRDPETGEVLDETLTEVARLRVSEAKEKVAICDVISGDVGAISKGMGVHLP
jgi:curli biogenesis system outer membrane secretion channel CsgG